MSLTENIEVHSSDEVGSALKILSQRMKEKENDTGFWENLVVDFINEKISQELQRSSKVSVQQTQPDHNKEIKQLKQQVKYSKNPLEIKKLNQEIVKIQTIVNKTRRKNK